LTIGGAVNPGRRFRNVARFPLRAGTGVNERSARPVQSAEDKEAVMTGKTITAITALALAGTMAFAAGPGEGQRRGERSGREDRGDRMARMAEELQLSDAQVDAIKQMRQAEMEQRRAHREQSQSLAKQWVELKDKGDTKGAEKLRAQLSAMKEEAQIRRLAGAGKLESVLTDEQKQKLEQLKSERGQHRKGRGPDGDDGPGGPPEK
jgi:Spy/CpxP family protein refolding chaperone